MGTIRVYLEENDVIVGNTVFLKLDANNKFHFDKCEDDMYYDGHSVYFDSDEGKYYYEEPDEEDVNLLKASNTDTEKEHTIKDIIETLCKLAHNGMIDELFRQEIIISEDEVWSEEGFYLDFAQKVFDRHYDYFYNEIYLKESNKQKNLEEEE